LEPLLQPDIGQVFGSLMAPGAASLFAPEHLEAQLPSLIAPGAASVLEHLVAQPSLMAPGAASVLVHWEAHLVAQLSLIAPGAALLSQLVAQHSPLPFIAPADTSDFWVLEQPTIRTATSTAESNENVRMTTFSFGLAGTSSAGWF